MIIKGKAVVVPGDNIDTDVLYPGSYLNIDNPEAMKTHLFEGLDESIRDRLQPGCVLVVEDNFGSGSSREHVVHAMKAWGVSCVVGKSFARIFGRNCVNLGLMIVTCAEAVDATSEGAEVAFDAESGVIDVDGDRFQADAIPPFMLGIITAGGLVPWARKRLSQDEPV